MTSGISHLAFLMPSAGWGGIERVNVHYANELARRGYRVDILLSRTEVFPYEDDLEPSVRVRPLGARHKFSAIPRVMRYLRTERPDVLITAKDHGAKVGLAAKWLSGSPTRVFLGIHNTLGTSETKRARRLGVRLLYRFADGLLAVSRGAAEDLTASFGIPREKIRTVHNPIVTPELVELGRAPLDHPWLQPDRTFATLIGCGRLSHQKDFATLLRALARIREERDARLILLGEGGQRPALEDLAAELGIAEAVELAGFRDNPFAYLARADLFVLSSAWEGFGNVVAEALAVGTPVVATDCPSGPREILADGEFGALVPVAEPAAMAAAIRQTLEQPPAPEHLQRGARPFDAATATDRLLEALDQLVADSAGSGAAAT